MFCLGVGEVQYWEGYCCVHQEGVWQKVQSNLALHCWKELRLICYPRDQV